MISKHLTILPAVAALLLCVACSEDDLTGSNSLSKGAYPLEIGSVSITAEVDDSSTRVSESTDGASSVFQEGDEITIQLGDETATYTIDADNNLTSDTPLYWQNTLDATVAAWYPSDVSEVSLADQSEGLAYVISATTTGNYQSSVSLTFSHQLAKVRIKLSGTVASSITSVEVYSSTSCSFDPATQTLTASETQDYILMKQCTYGEDDAAFTCWEANVVPGEIATPSTFIRLNGSIIVPFSAITELEAGNVYTIDIDLSNSDPTIETNADGTTTYIVFSKTGLLAWAKYVLEGNWSTNCTLAANVDITGEEWTAVGNRSNEYTGTFDGNGHTITGLTIKADGTGQQGLIGNLGSDGVVKNLTLESVSISDADGGSIGAVVGYNYGIVSDCSVSGTIGGSDNIGGVVGRNYGTVTNCHSTCTVTGTSDVGGVVGYNNSTVTACYSTGSVSGLNIIGGVVGYNNSTVTACYSTGSVNGGSEISGVVGHNNGTVTACYSTGSVIGSEYTGGVVGSMESGTITACYWYNSSTDSDAAEYGIGNPESDDDGVTTKVDGIDVTWTSAKTVMNTALTGSGWQYDGDGTGTPPLTLVEE